MSIRCPLLLPAALSLAAALALALWPQPPWPPTLPAALAGVGLVLLAAQAVASERRRLGALRAVRAALAGATPPALPDAPWRAVLAQVEALQADAARQREAAEQASAACRRTTEALQASEERYVLAVRGSQDGLWEWDIASGRLALSARWMHLFGGGDDARTTTLADWAAALHPEDRAEALHALQSLAHGGERVEHVHRVRHADGRYRWVLSRGSVLRRASGQAYRVVGLDADITRIKRIESIIEEIAEGTAGRSGEPFFQSLVQHFAQALHIDCAFVTECVNRPPTRVRTLAFWQDGGFGTNFEYDLADTPCDPVVRENRAVFHPHGLADLFDCEPGQQSYLGLPIVARDGGVLGHLAFVDRAPMPPDIVRESIYRIFTARAAVEIELARALQRMKAAGPQALAAG